MKRLAWMTDIHLNFLQPPAIEAFLTSLSNTETDAFLIGGDIGEAPNVALYLNALSNQLQRPIYFVLGNHDFYRGSIAGVRETVRKLCSAIPNLFWLPEAGVVPLTDGTCLVGHDGWGDGRLGDYFASDVMLMDWGMIQEFEGFDEHPRDRLAKLNALGDGAAAHFHAVLPEALRRFQHIIVLTHVPPFREACWHEGKISDNNWLPHFTCKAAGDALIEAMASAPDRHMTVLCGHTHGGGEAHPLANIRVLTGAARYGQPVVQRVVEVE
jgi:hypothetical protein